MRTRAAVVVCVVVAGLIGSIPPADAAPVIPISSCPFTADQPGRTYRFTGNVTCGAGQTGVHITGDNVTLDLGGNTLEGAGGLVGIVVDGNGHITIRNGTVTGFIDGLDTLTNRDVDVTVNRIVAASNIGHGFRTSVRIRIVESVAVANGKIGFIIGAPVGDPPRRSHFPHSVLRSSVAARNGEEGINVIDVLEDALPVRLIDVVSTGNGDEGALIEIDDARVIGAHITGNGDAGQDNGITIEGDNAHVVGSVVSGNYFGGIVIEGGNATLQRNRTEGNGWGTPDTFGTGMLVTGSVANATRNLSRGNDDAGIDCNPTPMCTSGSTPITPKRPPIAIEDCTGTFIADQPGRTYVLSEDLACPVDGISVSADNVIIDLNGATLSGSGTGDGVYFGADVRRGRVRNGTIMRFHDGIQTSAGEQRGQRIVIERVAIIRSTGGAILAEAPTTIADASVVLSGGYGAVLTAAGNRIVRSYVTGTGDDGIAVSGKRAAIARSTVTDAGNDDETFGVDILADLPRVTGSRIVGSFAHGLRHGSDNPGGVITGNRMLANGWGVPDYIGHGIASVSGARGRNIARGNDVLELECVPQNLCHS